jgi:hypothetical protein
MVSLAQLLARLQTMQPFHQDETFAVLPHQDRLCRPTWRMLSAISCAFLGSSVARRFTGTYMFAIANVSRFIMAGNPAFVCSLQLILHLVSDHRHRRLLRAGRERPRRRAAEERD